MIEALPEAPLTSSAMLGPYRVADYRGLPDEPRVELVYGRLLLVSSPVLRHQVALMQLLERLRATMRPLGCRVIMAPMDVTLADHSIVQPDLLVVSPERKDIIGERIEGAPDLLVEVLSPSTARLDRGDKLRLYAESNVREYWLVDPAGLTIEFLVQREGRWLVALPEDGVYASEAIEGLGLDLRDYWVAVDTELAES
jgi:Uma2 family endonuclease